MPQDKCNDRLCADQHVFEHALGRLDIKIELPNPVQVLIEGRVARYRHLVPTIDTGA